MSFTHRDSLLSEHLKAMLILIPMISAQSKGCELTVFSMVGLICECYRSVVPVIIIYAFGNGNASFFYYAAVGIVNKGNGYGM